MGSPKHSGAGVKPRKRSTPNQNTAAVAPSVSATDHRITTTSSEREAVNTETHNSGNRNSVVSQSTNQIPENSLSAKQKSAIPPVQTVTMSASETSSGTSLFQPMCGGGDEKSFLKLLRSSDEGLQKLERMRERSRPVIDPFSDWQSPVASVAVDRSLKKRLTELSQDDVRPGDTAGGGLYVPVLWRASVDHQGQYLPNNAHYRSRKFQAIRERSTLGGPGRQRTLSNLQTPTGRSSAGRGQQGGVPVDRRQFQRSVAQDLHREFTHLLSRSNTKLDSISESSTKLGIITESVVSKLTAKLIQSAEALELRVSGSQDAVGSVSTGPFSEKVSYQKGRGGAGVAGSSEGPAYYISPSLSLPSVSRSSRREKSSLIFGQSPTIVSLKQAAPPTKSLENIEVKGKETMNGVGGLGGETSFNHPAGNPTKDGQTGKQSRESGMAQLGRLVEDGSMSTNGGPADFSRRSAQTKESAKRKSLQDEIGLAIERQPTRFRELFGSEAYRRQDTNIKESMTGTVATGRAKLDRRESTSIIHGKAFKNGGETRISHKLAQSVEKYAKKMEEKTAAEAAVAAASVSNSHGPSDISKQSLTRLRFTSTSGEMMSIPLYAKQGTISWMANSGTAANTTNTNSSGKEGAKVNDPPGKNSRKKTELVIALNAAATKGNRSSNHRKSMLQQALTTFKYNGGSSVGLADKAGFRLAQLRDKVIRSPSARRRTKVKVMVVDKSSGPLLVRHKLLPKIAGKRILNR